MGPVLGGVRRLSRRGAVLAMLLAAGCAMPGDRVVNDGPRVRLFDIPGGVLGPGTRPLLVYLPPAYDGPDTLRRFGVVYFLHGSPGGPEDWFRKGRLASVLDTLIARRRIPEIIAVAPDGRGLGRKGRSLWMDSWDGRSRIETHLVTDVVGWVDAHLRTIRDAHHRALAGISDGADGAVHVLLHHGGEFGAAAALSGRFHPHGPWGIERVVGPPPGSAARLRDRSALGCADSLFATLRAHRVYVDAGLLDRVPWDALALGRRLARFGIPSEVHLYPGWHEWFWWRRRLELALPAITSGFGAAAGAGRAFTIPRASAFAARRAGAALPAATRAAARIRSVH